ncbi:MAG: UdgX family uracil-DNA binding protein [Actinomycetota bacterium]|nr:UdgX family uracil-DNA binding protein [Actinomycetota bacterium]
MTSAADFFPPGPADLDALRAAAAGCRGCDLYRDATQAVFGQGAEQADVVLVGEQPGDREDREGEPFVGPAGRLLDRALEEAGIDRERAYITNVVKHFKWKPSGKRRIHQKPNAEQIGACRPWLDAELSLLRPKIVVCLGATAAQALLGRSFKVTQQRGRLVPWDREPLALATVHPSSILRAPDDESRAREFDAFVADLRVAAGALVCH